MKLPRPTTIDFETFKIEGRPAYPPVPVGVSIKRWGKKSKYYSWGHPSGNNCTKAQAAAALNEVWDLPDGLLFQNSRFDIDVAEVHLKLKLPKWRSVHDTMLLLFLDNPHRRVLGLKECAEEVLGWPPDERDAVADWLVQNQPVDGVKITKSKQGKHPAGAYIAYAPGTVVGPYANGDVDRTEALFKKLWPSIVERGMLAAYDRERRLSPVLLDMERRGIRVDVDRLARDVTLYHGWLGKIDAWLRKRLNVPLEMNLDSGGQLLEAMQDRGVIDMSLVGVTEKGNYKTDKTTLATAVTDKLLAAVLKYRTQLGTCLGTFMEPWLATARMSGGLIFTTWNAVRSPGGGARTGRFSSSPNFQNIPKEFEAIFMIIGDADTKHLPKCPWKDLPALPLCRSYVIPYQKDHVLAGRDYSQQEPRILAHFEDGVLKDQYLADPWIDYHDNAKDHLQRVFGRPFKRKPVKNINLGIIYGQGIGSLAEKNDETYEDTKKLRDAIFAMYPGLKDMYDDMRARAQAKLPIRTWGGREYYCEEPAIVRGRIMTFDYKMVNVLIQGSAADCTKEAMIRYFEDTRRPENHFLILSVHDELVLSLPANELAWGLDLLRQAMESVEFDVQILSEGAWSNVSWGNMIDYDKKGKILPVPANTNFPKQKKRA